MNLLDYVKTEFASFEEKPFNELDAAVLTQMAMVRIELAATGYSGYHLGEDGVLRHETTGESLHFALRDLLCAEYLDSMFTGLAAPRVQECLMAAAMSPRYRGLVITGYQTVLDAQREVQFSATTFRCDAFTFVGFRGTDATLTGWREDFNLAYMDTVPAQSLAVDYVKAELLRGVTQPFYLGGHSKGGNLAEYVMLVAPLEKRGRVAQAFSFDGPGFKENAFTQQQFLAIAPRFHKLVPQDSIIGMILDSDSPFGVVESSELGFMQHDLFSWEIQGDSFVRRDGLTPASLTIDLATRVWIHSYSELEICDFVHALFDAADSSGALDLQTLFGGGIQSVSYLRAAASSVGDQHAEILRRFATDLAEALGASVVDQANEAFKAARDQVVDQANEALKSARDQVVDQVEERWRAMRQGRDHS